MSFLRTSRLFLTIQNIATPQTFNQKRLIKRWVGPTLRELKNRKEKLNSVTYTPRNTFIEWNQNSEVFAFGHRLKENFDLKHLHAAFTNRSYVIQEELRHEKLGIENPQGNINDNQQLILIGERLIADYVQSFLDFSLINCPKRGIEKIFNWLTSEEQIAFISKNLGTSDLILCANNQPDNKTLRDTFVAIVGALAESSGEEVAYTFIRDFICIQLNQQDLSEIWEIENPLNELQEYCKTKNLAAPEPRLIGEAGKNTVLAAFHVGIYFDKKMKGKGFGESIPIAINMAALDVLRSFYGIQENMKPFNFQILLEKSNKKELKQTL